MRLTGRSLVAAMCVGQLGNLLPHVTVPAIMAQSLMPLRGLNATEAGAMASGLAFGYMLAVPVLATPPLRVCAYVAHLFPEQGHCRNVSLEHRSAFVFAGEIPLTRRPGGARPEKEPWSFSVRGSFFCLVLVSPSRDAACR